MRALTELKKECFKRIGFDRCFCCGESKLKRLLAHHLSYTSKSVIYNQYGNSDDERLKYHSYLLDEIGEDRTNFLVLCFSCHKKLEEMLRSKYEQVMILAQKTDLDERFIAAYNLTCMRRGLQTLENPEDFHSGPDFLRELWVYSQCFTDPDNPNKYSKESLSNDIKILYNKIKNKQFSLVDFSSTAIISQELEYYIKPYPGYIISARLLESVRNIEKGSEISYIKVTEEPYWKPIELVNKNTIDVDYYLSWFEGRFIRDFQGMFEKYDFNVMIDKSGLDEFFWS